MENEKCWCIGTRLASYVYEKDGQKYIERRALEEVFKIGGVQPIQPFKTVKTPEENNVEQRLYATLQATIVEWCRELTFFCLNYLFLVDRITTMPCRK